MPSENAQHVTLDGNEAAALIAYALSEVIAIYPITPSSTMGEWADEWASQGKKNLWGDVPLVQEMQSEGGVAGAIHGALQAGSLASTFTASQGLLLMIPNMYKIAGELTPTVFHIAARTLATHALSIFGDHSDVMAARGTGWAMLCSANVQEIHDLALVSHMATLRSRIPFVHFFDGFRSSHEVSKIIALDKEIIRNAIDDRWVEEHRSRRLSPENPVLRGTAQNPDVFFQSREACNLYYDACADFVQNSMDTLANLTGRKYQIFEYSGAKDAERIIIVMGSATDTVKETMEVLNGQGEKLGLLQVRLFRPFSVKHFISALPESVKAIAVLDRCKEPGSVGEPLYQDIVNALYEARQNEKYVGKNSHSDVEVNVIGGRYGLSSKEFSPAMAKAVFDELKKDKPKNHFTIGILDDVTHSSLSYDESFITEDPKGVRALFYGLGADGTVSANKSSIKIIGEDTENYAQGYFVYDSKKSGAMTVSHLRFGPNPIRSSYLLQNAHFIACHQSQFLQSFDMLTMLLPGGTFLINCSLPIGEVWKSLPQKVQIQLHSKNAKLFTIDAYAVARECGMGGRINTVMQTCFFAISGVLPSDQALTLIKQSIKKTYGKKGDLIVKQNWEAVDKTLAHLHQVEIPALDDNSGYFEKERINKFGIVDHVIQEIIAGRGDCLPVSVFPVDGTYPTGTAKLEKRNIGFEIPVWDEKICIQCGKCVFVCPHSVIRAKVCEPSALDAAPSTFKSTVAKARDWAGKRYILQVAPEDCTGCGICVDICPVKNKSETRLKAINMATQAPLRETEKVNWEFFENLPSSDADAGGASQVRTIQVKDPLFEFSGACSGCGETPYLKLLSQLFGDRALIANATGCSSIYGGNLPTTPWTKNSQGRGPAWANSLFEDNAEFGLGMRLSLDQQTQMAFNLLHTINSETKPAISIELTNKLIDNAQKDEASIQEQRDWVDQLKVELNNVSSPQAKRLLGLLEFFVKKSVWIVGGDGWAYDIGFGGLDHVLASGKNVNILVLDTEVYSNTGGQASKATPRAAVAKFAIAGKAQGKKDLAKIAMSYGNVYVAQVAMGAKDEHTLKAFIEAEAHDGPSLIIAYSHCIAHGTHMQTAMREQKDAVQSGHWMLFRHNPNLVEIGKNPFSLDCQKPSMPLRQFYAKQNRFHMLTKSHPESAEKLFKLAEDDALKRWKSYEQMLHVKEAQNAVPELNEAAKVNIQDTGETQ